MAAALSTLSDKTHVFAKKHPGVDPTQQRRGEDLKSTANRSSDKMETMCH